MPISGADKSRLRELMLKMRADAESLLQRQQQSICAQNGEHRPVGDLTDGMQADEVTGTVAIIAAKAAATIRKADRALANLGSHDYGTCTRCWQEIPLSRLEALPFASLCISCTEEDEQEVERDKHTPVYGRDKRRNPVSQFV